MKKETHNAATEKLKPKQAKGVISQSLTSPTRGNGSRVNSGELRTILGGRSEVTAVKDELGSTEESSETIGDLRETAVRLI